MLCAAGAVLCLNDIKCLNKNYYVINSDMSCTTISKYNIFNSYYFIHLHAKLAQNITCISAPDLIREYAFYI